MSDWKAAQLQDICSFISRGVTPFYIDDGGIAVLNQRCIRNQIVSFDNQRRTDPEQRNVPSERYLKVFDILVNSTGKGTLGRVAQVTRLYEPTTVDSHVTIVRPRPEAIMPQFLGLILRSREIEIESMGRGSTGQTELPKSILSQMSVLIPAVRHQTFSVEVIFHIDNHIASLETENETLESAARTIFKSWFVDFDPVQAKVRGEHPPGMDAETAALFPDTFEESELGLIPRGWRVVPIGDHVKANKGLSYKGAHLEETIEDGLPMHNLNSVNEWGGYKFDGIKFYSGDYKPRHEVMPGDLIVANTEQGFNLLLIASPAIVPAVFGDKGIISHHIYKLEIKRKSPLTRLFLYHMIMLPPFRDVLQGYTNGTTVNMLPSDAFEKPRFVMPPAELMQRFDALVAPMLEQVERNYEKSTTLAETRDALLPRLVSGELRVGEVEDIP